MFPIRRTGPVASLASVLACFSNCLYLPSNNLAAANWEGATVHKELYDEASNFCSSYGSSVAISITRNGCRIAVRVGSSSEGYAICVDGVVGPRYEEIAEESPLFSGNGASIAYCARKAGGWCWVVNGVESPVFTHKLDPTSFAFSYDGKRYAYAAAHPTEVFVVADGKIVAGGSDLALIPNELAPGFSPDGKRLIYAEFLGSGGVRVNDQGKAHPHFDGISRCISPGFGAIRMMKGSFNSQATPNITNFNFSSDSRRLSYSMRTKDGKCMVIDEVPSPPYDEIGYDFAFSPDGSDYAFFAQLNGQPSIIRHQEPPLPIEILIEWTLTYSPDGKHLAFAGMIDGQNAVWVDGKPAPADIKIRHLVNGTAFGNLPDSTNGRTVLFSPDSQRLAFKIQNSTGISQQSIWVVDGKAGLASSTLWGSLSFSPDSAHFAYAIKPAEKNHFEIVVDGAVCAIHPRIYGPVFKHDGTLEYLALDEDEKIYRYRVSGL